MKQWAQETVSGQALGAFGEGTLFSIIVKGIAMSDVPPHKSRKNPKPSSPPIDPPQSHTPKI